MSAPLGCSPGSFPSNFYVWRASDDFSIQLSLKVVAQLASHISRAGVDSDLRDLRGILLGRTIHTPTRSTVIEDFELLAPSEENRDDNVLALADSDDLLFGITSRMTDGENGLRALGFFRAHRDGTLNMSSRNLETFNRFFGEIGNVALLIRAPRGGESEAALSYWQGDGAHPRDFGFGFPLDAGRLASGHPGLRFPNPFNQTQPAALPLPNPTVARQRPPVPQRSSEPVSFSSENIRWSRLLPTAALVVCGFVAVQLAANSNRSLASETGAAQADSVDAGAASRSPEPAHIAQASGETALGLTVASREHQLEIRWNRRSPAILAADRGMMRIADAGITEAVPFDPAQLRDGYVAYTPKSNDVSIRLELTAKDGGATSESIRAVGIP